MARRRYDGSYRRFENQNEKYGSEAPVEKKEEPTTIAEKDEFKPLKVRVYINNLNIRKGAGLSCPKTGKFTGPGVFTITEIENGFGKLESGEGWISLEFCEVVK